MCSVVDLPQDLHVILHRIYHYALTRSAGQSRQVGCDHLEITPSGQSLIWPPRLTPQCVQASLRPKRKLSE
jgi:hypothetical protein